ncbi:alpha/beta fold hydrolase [Pacificibacter marinus]|uniref:Phospholipase YtpA n=1 Tax=Pacificibacter marinus TaxID=658057 RepID=A0A1Y5SKJ7_9RHOB|nr:alpha/beta hydrolase [Pacificibacter marinus]SEK61191.1 lysophospholipase [Pacificibacter marinus]SLN41714.1 Phospholipase YtpA [Pacificibacter marinus]
MQTAPFFADVSDGPDGGKAYWLKTADGIRIRAGVWPYTGDANDGQAKGTVFVLPGRTECVEKYGRAAKDLAARGYASLAIDWRGQGIADRLLPDRTVGHVNQFEDYQKDLAAVLNMARDLELPKPWFLIGHSMGGAIGLRALLEGAPFEAASFCAPMWGIGLTPVQKVMVRFLAPVLSVLKLDRSHAPGTSSDTYMMVQDFDGNTLTRDPDMYDYMRKQVAAHPDLGLGGPSTHWVRESIGENIYLDTQESPDVPVLCFLGGDESIVNTAAVRARMDRWPSGILVEIPNAQHEIPMEVPQSRALFFNRSCALFDANL